MAAHNLNSTAAGAFAIREALRLIPQTVAGDGTQTGSEYFSKREAAIASLFAAAGPMLPEAIGAFRVLAEFIVGGEQDGGSYDLERWEPMILMSEAEFDEYQNRILAAA